MNVTPICGWISRHTLRFPAILAIVVTRLVGKSPVLRIVSADDGCEVKFLMPAKRFPIEVEEGISNVDSKSAAVWYESSMHSKCLETRKRDAAFVAQIISKSLANPNVLHDVSVDNGIGSTRYDKVGYWYVAPILKFKHLGIGIGRIQESAFLNR